MKKEIKEVFGGLKSLFTGMRITMGQFFKPSVTVQYPHQTLPIPPRFRGHIELVKDPETGRAVCYACKLCEKACPSDCIIVEGAKLEEAKKKSVSKYVLDFTKCSLCGSCVEACRDGAIRFSREYNLASLTKDEFLMDLFHRLQEESGAAATAAPPETPAALPATPAAAPVPAQQTTLGAPSAPETAPRSLPKLGLTLPPSAGESKPNIELEVK